MGRPGGVKGPSGGCACGAAPLTSRAAGPAMGCMGCTGCRGSTGMGSGCWATDCKTEAGGDPAATRRDPADSQGSHRGARASVLTRASARGSVISPCGTSWRRRGNRRPVVPGASRRAGTMDRGTRARAAGGGGASGQGLGSRGVARSGTHSGPRGKTVGSTTGMRGRTKG